MELEEACFVGRAWSSEVDGPILLGSFKGRVYDLTSRECPTVRDLLEREDPVDFIHWRIRSGAPALMDQAPLLAPDSGDAPVFLLSPFDLQPVKACGVTFADSMIERVIEERAGGNPAAARDIRSRIGLAIGEDVHKITPGSAEAAALRQALIAENLWSQYLEVGIGPDAEIFTKAQVLSSVGQGADIGILRVSHWNNPEPEVVLAVNSRGEIKGATLGNDVNLRDIEGRSALLLGKAKDNNASCALGPMIRLFDKTYGLRDVRSAKVHLKVEGVDGFILNGHSSMEKISRDPEDLVRQAINRNHQYPDGFALFLGTLFAPIEDRDTVGGGFTHKVGDCVTLWTEKLGALHNRVRYCDECPEWRFGLADFMRNLARRHLI